MSRFFDLKVCPEPNTGCLLWTGCTTEGGYGRVGIGSDRTVLTHRFSWERVHGPVPQGMDVCHRCDTPACVNVEHLFIGTRRDNVLDMHAKGRQSMHARPSGERHHAAKLTEVDVADIRHARAIGVRGVFLAKVYGVTPTTITQVALGRTWSTQCV
jgi:hypothetical protein